jgi:hypothetical protein
MPILLAGTIEFVHIEQVSTLSTFLFEQVLLYFANLTAVSGTSAIIFDTAYIESNNYC